MTKEKRPVMICHMLTSLNGKIDGEFMSHPDGQLARQHYNRIRNEFQCEAVVYGQVTMKGGYASGVRKVAESEAPLSHPQDYLACTDADHYIVSLDPQGTNPACAPDFSHVLFPSRRDRRVRRHERAALLPAFPYPALLSVAHSSDSSRDLFRNSVHKILRKQISPARLCRQHRAVSSLLSRRRDHKSFIRPAGNHQYVLYQSGLPNAADHFP